MYYPQDRSSPVTKYVLQYSLSPSFADTPPHPTLEVIVTANTTASHRANQGRRQVNTHTLTALTPGAIYYVRVVSVNSVGRGGSTVAVNTAGGGSAIAPLGKADPIPVGAVQLSTIPASAFVSVKEAASSLKVAFSAPADTHGAAVNGYKIQWWDATVVTAAQVVAVSVQGAGGGSFCLSYNGSRTDYLPVMVGAEGMRTALEGLPDIRSVQVASLPSFRCHCLSVSLSLCVSVSLCFCVS